MASETPTGRSPTARAVDFLLHLPNVIRLYWRLFRDPRVSLWPKAFLLAAVAYVALPFDLIPDVIPFIGEVDDLAVLIVAGRWFIQWCPADVVREHVQRIDAGEPRTRWARGC